MEKKPFFLIVRDYLKGNATSDELKSHSRIIFDIEEDRYSRAKTKLELKFSESSFTDLLSLGESDTWFYSIISGDYRDFDFVDTGLVAENFEEGYDAWHYFDEENKNLLNEIATMWFSLKLDFDDYESKKQMAQFLTESFPDEVNNIISDFTVEKNRMMTINAEEQINSELDVLKKNVELFDMDIDLQSYSIVLTISGIVQLYLQNGDFELNLKKTLKDVFDSLNLNIGNWMEDLYDYERDDSYFDKERFNRDANRQLEKIHDKIKDDESLSPDFFDMIKEITKKFELHKVYDLPKNRNYVFAITGFDRDNLKIKVNIWPKDTLQMKEIKLSKENFYNLLYQPSLFKFDELYNI